MTVRASRLVLVLVLPRVCRTCVLSALHAFARCALSVNAT